MKYLMKVTGQEAKEARVTNQLCEGMEACIEGGIFIMHLLFHKHDQEEDWGLLLIDA